MSREKQELSQLMNKEYKCVLLAAARAVGSVVLHAGLEPVLDMRRPVFHSSPSA